MTENSDNPDSAETESESNKTSQDHNEETEIDFLEPLEPENGSSLEEFSTPKDEKNEASVDSSTTDSERSTELHSESDPFDSQQYDDREGDPFESDLFQEADSRTIDEQKVWDQLTEESDGTTAETETSSEASVEQADDDVVTVSKSTFCQECDYFEPPPDVGCTHQGTQILEFIGMEQVRVSNCPVVQREREIGRTFEDTTESGE